MKDLLSHEVLSPAEETLLFRKLRSAERIIKKLKNSKRTGAETAQLRLAEKQREECRQRAITCNLRMVVSVARKKFTAYTTDEELISAGMPKLIKCVDLFDPDRGFKFSTYLYRALLNEFVRYNIKEGKCVQMLIGDQGIRDNCSRMAHEPGNSLFEIRDILEKNSAYLTELEAFIIRHRFGIGQDVRDKTLYEISVIVGLSKERIRQIEVIALDKLRNVLGVDLDDPETT